MIALTVATYPIEVQVNDQPAVTIEVSSGVIDLEVGPGGTTTWDNVADKPATFPPSTHDNTAHSVAYATEAALSLKISVPVGAPLAWLKSYPNTPALPAEFVEMNGQTLSDADSPYNGQVIPNLNGSGGGTKRFLRGSTTSGTTGGTETHTHSMTSTVGAAIASCCDGVGFASGCNYHYHLYGNPCGGNPTGSSGTLPSYYEVVYIMRIK